MLWVQSILVSSGLVGQSPIRGRGGAGSVPFLYVWYVAIMFDLWYVFFVLSFRLMYARFLVFFCGWICSFVVVWCFIRLFIFVVVVLLVCVRWLVFQLSFKS